MRLRFARKNNATIQWLMSFMAVWNKRVDGFHTPFQTRLDDYMIFGGFHIGIQHHCQAPPLLPLQNKMHNSSISQQTSPSHSDPCTVYLPTHLLDFYGKCSYRYTIRIQSYPYINPMGMRFSHFNLTIRQTLRAHVFWSVAFSCLARCSSGSGRHFFRGGGRFFLTSEFAGGVRLFRRFGDLARDLGIWRVRKTRDLQNVQNFPTPTIKATTFTHHHLRIEPGKSRFKVGEKIHDHLGCECLTPLFNGKMNSKLMIDIQGSGWWLNQPSWKICSSKWESSPSRGENKGDPLPTNVIPLLESNISQLWKRKSSSQLPVCKEDIFVAWRVILVLQASRDAAKIYLDTLNEHLGTGFQCEIHIIFNPNNALSRETPSKKKRRFAFESPQNGWHLS